MRRKAFTLVELLVVIAIIGLLSTIAVVSLGTARTKAKAARAIADLRQINTVLQMYVDANGGYPCFDHDFSDSWETTWSAPYMKWPKNPYGSRYHFEHGAVAPGYIYSISLESVPASEAAALVATSPTQFNNSAGTRWEYLGVDQSLPVPSPETCP